MRRLCRVRRARTRWRSPLRLEEPVEVVVRAPFARICATCERDAFDAAPVEEGSELLDFAALVAEDEDLGELDGPRTCCALCMHQCVFCPDATDAALDVRALVP